MLSEKSNTTAAAAAIRSWESRRPIMATPNFANETSKTYARSNSRNFYDLPINDWGIIVRVRGFSPIREEICEGILYRTAAMHRRGVDFAPWVWHASG